MSEDPETASLIDKLERSDKPLLVADVDEVILEFVKPFQDFLATRDLILKTDTFKLNGNIVDRESDVPVEDQQAYILLDDFFAEQDNWQGPVDGVVEALDRLSSDIQIVMLTAMPHRYRDLRRRVLDRHDLTYPLITTEKAKGPAVKQLRLEPSRPVGFIDDIAYNLVSVGKSVPDAHLFHLMSHSEFRSVMPALPAGIYEALDWPDAARAIVDKLASGS